MKQFFRNHRHFGILNFMETKKYLTITELCDYLSASKSTIYKKTMRKEIPFVKNGGKVLFNREEIDRWLAGNNGSNSAFSA